jgi:hypothetical protein
MLCGCETFRKRALISRSGKVQEVVCHGVGSVFCPREYRRRGYAHRMMYEVGKKLKTWQEGALFSVLFSDIGKEFYSLNGWEPFNSSHITVPASSSAPTAANLPEARPLYAEDLAELCRIDEQLLRKSMQHVPPLHSSKVFVAIIPEITTIRWHHAREDFVACELYGRVPKIKGAIVDGNGPGKRVWCYWTRMWYNENPAASHGNTLHVLRLVVEEYGALDWERPSTDEEDRMKCKYAPAIAALLRLAQREAAAWKMEEVEVWNPTVVTVEAVRMLKPKARVVDRESESIASLRWYGEAPQKGGRVTDFVDWIGNEKYGWS